MAERLANFSTVISAYFVTLAEPVNTFCRRMRLQVGFVVVVLAAVLRTVTTSVTRSSESRHFTWSPKAGVAGRQATGERGKWALCEAYWRGLAAPWGLGELTGVGLIGRRQPNWEPQQQHVC
jgi:hypothetical protein